METYREYAYVASEHIALRKKGYAAISYIDHRSDGRKIEGSEDFSKERYASQVVERVVYKKTGEKDKGGHNRWESVGTVRSRSTTECRKIAAMLIGADVQLRKY